MTTSVTVHATLPNDKEVSVLIESDSGAENHVLQNGEKQEFHVYDDRKITVCEVEKKQNEPD